MRKHPKVPFIVLALTFCLATACDEDSDETPFSSNQGGKATCAQMCTKIRGAGFRGCDHEDAEEQDRCVEECQEHLDDGEANQEQLECAVKALNCDAWKECGDLL